MCFIKDSWRYETSGLTLLKFGDKIKRRLYLFFTSNKKYPCSTIQQEQLLRRFTEWMENGLCSAAALLFFFCCKSWVWTTPWSSTNYQGLAWGLVYPVLLLYFIFPFFYIPFNYYCGCSRSCCCQSFNIGDLPLNHIH